MPNNKQYTNNKSIDNNNDVNNSAPKTFAGHKEPLSFSQTPSVSSFKLKTIE